MDSLSYSRSSHEMAGFKANSKITGIFQIFASLAYPANAVTVMLLTLSWCRFMDVRSRISMLITSCECWHPTPM